MNALVNSAEPHVSLAEFDLREILSLLCHSKEFFLEFFLSDEIKPGTGVPDFHLLVFNRFTDLTQRKDVAALPREHAKTTLLRLAVIYCTYFTKAQFFVYISSAHHMAVPSVESMWNRIIADSTLAVFGAPEVIKERLAEGHIEFYVTAYEPETMRPYKKLVIYRALGAKQSLRGMNIHNLRPEYVACDDIETEEHVQTEAGYIKLKTWFDNTLMRAISRAPGRTKIAQIGNLIGIKTLLNDNINDPDWRSIRLGVIRKNGNLLWPEAFTMDEVKSGLESAKRRNQLTAWFGEMMNMPLNSENSLIGYEQIRYTPARHPADGVNYRSFITIDPAISQRDSADDAAVVLHTIDPSGHVQVSDYIVGHLGVDGITEAVKTLCQRWNCWVIGCESVQLQVVLLNYFEIAFQLDNMHGFDFVPIEVGRAHKTARLKTWCAAMIDGEYSITESDWAIAQQLIQFDTRKDNNADDLIDACSMGLYMLRNYSNLIYADRAATVTVDAIAGRAVKQSTTSF